MFISISFVRVRDGNSICLKSESLPLIEELAGPMSSSAVSGSEGPSQTSEDRN